MTFFDISALSLCCMKKDKQPPRVFHSISELHRALGLPKPLHPLVTLVNYKDIQADTSELSKGLVLNFYKISYKKHLTGKIKYGQGYYDFDEGGLSFTLPNQLLSTEDTDLNLDGFTLHIHPDFLQNYPLAAGIKKYGFFSYSVAEALHLSEKEKEIIISIFDNIRYELSGTIDNFSQDIVISQIEQLLNYSNRFYSRQFITRKAVHHDQLAKFESLLADYFDHEKTLITGLPSVQYFSDQLNVSPHYLGDMLRSLTGQNTQQHIHAKLIEKAKELLGTSPLSIAEIAYKLGFEHPQSFHKIFKKKVNVSPLEFRESFQ